MELSTEQIDLLRVVEKLQTADSLPGTEEVGRRLVEMWKNRGGTFAWRDSAPWHGTDPYADQLDALGLLKVHVGMASIHRWDEPAKAASQYGLSVTVAGRQELASARADRLGYEVIVAAGVRPSEPSLVLYTLQRRASGERSTLYSLDHLQRRLDDLEADDADPRLDR